MKRLLVIPAAGRGSRLGWDGPKALCPVAGRPMVDHLLERYRPWVDRVVVVTSPAGLALIQRHLEQVDSSARCVVQPEPTGMLPAVLCARPMIEADRPDEVWITWCDQIGISAGTAAQLAAAVGRQGNAAAMAFPTVRQQPPYIHFDRNDEGRIIGVRQRRDGDEMPDVGESDAGLFAMRRDIFLQHLAEYDRGSVESSATGERNFLPFVPWLAARAHVHTFALDDPLESLGVNTPMDLDILEKRLSGL